MSELTGKKLPFRLDRGSQYVGMCAQTTDMEEWSRTKYLYAGVHHSMSSRPFRARVKPISGWISPVPGDV
jgi:hypothetical protein